MSERFVGMFSEGALLSRIADSKQGLATADNKLFVREWYEVVLGNICFSANNLEEASESKKKWFPYNKGGECRKWYGNNDFIVNWYNDGYEIKHNYDEHGKLRSRPQNTEYYFKRSFSWSLISSNTIAFRYKPQGHIFDVAGMSCFADQHFLYLLALCNTKIVIMVLRVIAPTINYQCGDIANIPVVIENKLENNIEAISLNNIELSKSDWDAYETSWDFKRHPLI